MLLGATSNLRYLQNFLGHLPAAIHSLQPYSVVVFEGCCHYLLTLLFKIPNVFTACAMIEGIVDGQRKGKKGRLVWAHPDIINPSSRRGFAQPPVLPLLLPLTHTPPVLPPSRLLSLALSLSLAVSLSLLLSS